MEVNAAESWKLADAYLAGDAEAVRAEARRKALTDATRKGTDVEAQAARQLAVSLAERAAAGSKAVAQLKADTTASAAANENVRSGVLAATDLNQALSDQAALQPYLVARVVDSAKNWAAWTRIIDETREALAKAHKQESATDFLQADAALDKRIDRSRYSAAIAGQPDEVRERLIAARDAITTATDKHYNAADAWNFVSKSLDAVAADQADRRARVVQDLLRDQREQLDLSQRELELVGALPAEHDAVIIQLQLAQQLKRAGVDLTGAEGRAILANAAKLSTMKQLLDDQRQSWDELRGAGETLFNDAAAFLAPENWNSWGDAGKRMIGDITSEFLKLAALNPLKNALFGGSAPTLSSVGGLLGGLFKGGGGGASFSFAQPFALPGFAGGTDSAPGGRWSARTAQSWRTCRRALASRQRSPRATWCVR